MQKIVKSKYGTKLTNGIGTIALIFLLTGCASSSSKPTLKDHVNTLEHSVNQLNEKIVVQSKQIERTTRATISSQDDLLNIQNDFQEHSGEIEMLKDRIKKLEESNNLNAERYASKINAHEQTIVQLQRQIARFELNSLDANKTSNPVAPTQKSQIKIKNAKDASKFLGKEYEQGNFKEVVQKSTTILQSTDYSDDIHSIALEFRGEGKFKLGDYRGAAIDLSSYIEKYPNGSKLGRALLLLGDSYVYLKNRTVAGSYYNECIKIYPNTPEGEACIARNQKL